MKTVILAVVLALTILACAPEEQSPQPMQPAPGKEPLNAQMPANAAQTKQAAQTEPDTGILAMPNTDTEKLFANIGNVKSYSFDVAVLPDKNAKYQYNIKGDKAKVVLQQPLLFPDKTEANLVYLDFTKKTAFASCSKGRPGCDPAMSKAVSYTDYEIVLPPMWVDKLVYGTKTRSLTYLNVPVNVVEYQADGKYYEAYVHNYYGMPLRVAIANDKEMTDVVGGYEYRSMSFNVLKDSDVVPLST